MGFDLIAGRRDIRRRVELLGHRTRLYEDLTATENLEFSCVALGLDAGRIPAALDRVALLWAAKERVAGYSQGMRQRVAIARALLRRPQLLLLDEPYAGLDVEGKEVVDDIVLEAQRTGRTVLLATHDLARGRIASRTVYLDEGRLLSGVRAEAGA